MKKIIVPLPTPDQDIAPVPHRSKGYRPDEALVNPYLAVFPDQPMESNSRLLAVHKVTEPEEAEKQDLQGCDREAR